MKAKEKVEYHPGKNEVEAEDILFFHSKCCMAHWELVMKDGEYALRCEKCGKPANLKFASKPPANASCDICGYRPKSV